MSTIGTLLITAWLGASALFVGSVAPAAFAVLPARAMAGALVGRILPVIFIAGLTVAALSFLLDQPYARTTLARVRAGALIVLAIACGIAQFVLAPRIAALRAEMGPVIEALAIDDPRRHAFGLLHATSVGWLGLGMLAAVVAIAVAVRAATLAQRAAGAPSAP